jgi:Mn2+/Fe2+ NRAMP family transporter
MQRYGPVWGWFAAGDLLVTNLVTLIAEFVVIRVGLAYFHLGAGVAAALGLVLVVVTLSGGRYWRWERIVLGRALVTFAPFPGGSLNTLLLLVASTIGATVTPWMVFFQQSASAAASHRGRPFPLPASRGSGWPLAAMTAVWLVWNRRIAGTRAEAS